MLRKVIVSCCFVAMLFDSCSILSLFRERDDFIRVRGTQLLHNGKPYYFVGTNLWYGGYIGSPGETGDRPRLLRELDSLRANGIVNLRILAASEESYIKRSLRPVIQRRPGEIDESLLQGLDFLLAEMAKRRMHGVLFLNNYWEWSGGMVQYNVWSGKDPVDPEDTTKGWGAFMDFSASFYSNQPANDLFRDYVRKVVTRTNTCNSRKYSEDPTIMAWQLANEPRPGRVGAVAVENLPVFYRWIDQTALFLHSLDTNHLVSTGSEGIVGSLLSSEFYLESHKTPHVDYLTMHLWPLNWGWFDPKRIPETLPETESKALDYIAKHLALARKLDKPIVMEEFGIDRDGGEIRAGTPTTARDRYFALVLRAIYDSARVGAPIAGSCFWGWGGEATAKHPDAMWRTGDPFMCDPPQEPQGRNSVFVSDTTTLRIIRENAFRMLRLGVVDTLQVKSSTH
jgi:mannan endo-1,4-beta-mannosidase